MLGELFQNPPKHDRLHLFNKGELKYKYKNEEEDRFQCIEDRTLRYLCDVCL